MRGTSRRLSAQVALLLAATAAASGCGSGPGGAHASGIGTLHPDARSSGYTVLTRTGGCVEIVPDWAVDTLRSGRVGRLGCSGSDRLSAGVQLLRSGSVAYSGVHPPEVRAVALGGRPATVGASTWLLVVPAAIPMPSVTAADASGRIVATVGPDAVGTPVPLAPPEDGPGTTLVPVQFGGPA